MKWLFSTHKATKSFLNSQRNHLHGGPCQRFLRASNSPIGRSTPTSSLYSGNYYSTSTIINASGSSYRLPNDNKIANNVISSKVDLEIISRETIGPSSPTPHHLRTFNFSIIDQFMYDMYTPLILFLPNTDQASVTDVVTKRSKHLKETLSEVLTRFYPLAGKVKDNLKIECNDEGVYYTEARVNQTLQDFLGYPSDERVRALLPESPCTAETSVGNYVLGIQVNIFKCGGIGLSTNTSHKIFDGQTFLTFMKAWAASIRGSPESISPSFAASEIFPNNPQLEYSAPSKLMATERLSTKRFMFDSKALALLKAQPVAGTNSLHSPSRMEATTAVIWKAAAKAASIVRPFGPQTPHALMIAVNMRDRASPPLPKWSIGNLFDVAGPICFPGSGQLDFPTLVGEVRKSIAMVNSDHIESRKGEKGHETFNEMLRGLNRLMSQGDIQLMSVTSMLNSGIYDLDFGWGKPIWFYVMNPGVVRFLALNDTLKGGGVEATVSLSPDEMEIFECDKELLSSVVVDPSPIQFVH